MTKIIYLDETGNAREGDNFIVSMVIIDAHKLSLIQKELSEIEMESHKGRRKWATSRNNFRVAYTQQLMLCESVLGIGYACVFPRLDDEIQQKCTAIALLANRLNLHKSKEKIIVRFST